MFLDWIEELSNTRYSLLQQCFQVVLNLVVVVVVEEDEVEEEQEGEQVVKQGEDPEEEGEGVEVLSLVVSHRHKPIASRKPLHRAAHFNIHLIVGFLASAPILSANSCIRLRSASFGTNVPTICVSDDMLTKMLRKFDSSPFFAKIAEQMSSSSSLICAKSQCSSPNYLLRLKQK